MQGTLSVRIVEGSSIFSPPWKITFVYLEGNYLRILKRELRPAELSHPMSLENFWDDIFIQVCTIIFVLFLIDYPITLQIRIPSNLDVSIDSQILENSQQLLEKHTILSGEGRTYNGSTVRWELAATSKKVSTQWLEALRRAKLELHDLETPDHLSFITGLVVRMKDSIEVCDRFHYLKPYKRCFMGDEAIAWIMRVRDCSLNEALTIGASMINLGLIYHVKREHFLCNKPFFYRFKPIAGAAGRVSGGRRSFHSALQLLHHSGRYG